MIKKAFKTIFILSLCIGITLPANAGNVDVSDGSAFITKSELSYELNNLSNRMAQLENSLDSKIDTLVSSYLTRNGIWNGVDQEKKLNYICDMFGYKKSDWTEYYTVKMPTSSSAAIELVMYDITRTVVERISKSGLLVAVVETIDQGLVAAADKTDKRSYLYLNSGAKRGRQTLLDNILYTDTSETAFYIDGENKGKIKAFGWIGENVNQNVTVAYHMYPGTYVVNFFVNKGDKLDFRYKQSMTPMSQSAWELLSGGTFVLPDETLFATPGIKIIFKSLTVY